MVSPTLAVATFNLLAPCYRRLNVGPKGVKGDGILGSGDDRETKRGYRRPRESEFAELWKSRCFEMCMFLNSEKFDVLCIQELWFQEEYMKSVHKCLSNEYEFICMQRTGSKADGLVTMIRRGKFEVIRIERLEFGDAGDRVALLLCLRILDSNSTVIVVNTHLTFPHSDYDRMLRQNQIIKLTEFVDGFLDRHGMESIPVLISGDLNGDISDPVSAHLRAHCYVNSYVHLTGLEDVETHLNHRNERVFVDHIWYRKHIYGSVPRQKVSNSNEGLRDTRLVPRTSLVIPSKKTTVQDWVDGFEISDHRLLSVTFTVESETFEE